MGICCCQICLFSAGEGCNTLLIKLAPKTCSIGGGGGGKSNCLLLSLVAGSKITGSGGICYLLMVGDPESGEVGS